MASELLVSEEPHQVDFWMYQEETFYEAMPPLVDPVSGDPYTLTGIVFDWWVRPSFDFATSLLHLISNSGTDKVRIESAAAGLIALYARQTTAAALPATPRHHWDQFMTMSFTDPDVGAVQKTLWRGALFILPGRTTG